MWRVFTRNVAKTMVMTAIGALHRSTATNWELPAKTVADMKAVSSGERPFWAAMAPSSTPNGLAAAAIGRIARAPSLHWDGRKGTLVSAGMMEPRDRKGEEGGRGRQAWR